MKLKPAILALAAASFGSAMGQTSHFWNGANTSANPAAGGTGTWSTSNAWRTVSATGAQGTWAAATGGTNNGILAGTAGTITLGTSGSTNFTGATLTVNTSGYTITSTNTSRNLVMTGALTLANSVSLSLDQNNTGATWGFSHLSLGSGASLTLQGIATANNANRINLTGGTTSSGGSITLAGSAAGVTGFVSTSGTSTLSSNILNNSATSATMLGSTSGDALVYSGVLSGSANLQISAGQAGGAGITTLSNVNTFTGNTYLNSSTNSVLRMGINDALPTGTTVFFGVSAGGGTADTGGSLDLNGQNLTVGALDSSVSTRGIANNVATLSTLTIGKASGSNAFGGVIGTVVNSNLTTQSANIAVIKTGGSTQTFSAVNNYTGDTTIKAGTLKLGASGTIAGSTSIIVGDGGSSGAVLDTTDKTGFTIADAQTLKGIGTVNVGTGNTLTIEGTHAVGNAGTDGGVGAQTITGNLSYAADSIFNWDLNADSTSTGFDTVSATGTIGVSTTRTVFNVIFGTEVDLGNAFWTTDSPTQSWSMASIFGQALTGGSSFASVTSTANPTTQGSFSITGSTLTWTAIPEPTSALAGLLIAAGLLRRRRVA